MTQEVLSSGDVGKLFGVNAKTVTRWAKEGLIDYFITPGGHYRYHREDVFEFLQNKRGLKEDDS